MVILKHLLGIEETSGYIEKPAASLIKANGATELWGWTACLFPWLIDNKDRLQETISWEGIDKGSSKVGDAIFQKTGHRITALTVPFRPCYLAYLDLDAD